MKKAIAQKIKSICHTYGINALYVFGSRCREIADFIQGKALLDTKNTRDVDIGILPGEAFQLTIQNKVNVTIDLEDLLNVSRVDLVVLTEVSPFLSLDAIDGELLYSAHPDETAIYELYVLRKAGDLAFYERERRRLILTGESK